MVVNTIRASRGPYPCSACPWQSSVSPAPLLIECVGSPVRRDHSLVAITHREQLVLGHDVLAAMLHVVLVDPRLHDGIDRTGLLAEAAGDALEEVDVVACRATRSVLTDVGFDGDRERRTDRLAELAGDAALLTVRVAAQCVQAAVAHRLRSL